MTKVTYHRKNAIIHTLICLLFFVFGAFLAYTVLFEEHGPFEILYYSTAAILSFWFVGPLFYWNLLRSFGNLELFSYDDQNIVLNDNRRIPWNTIKSIKNKAPGMNKFALPVPSYFHLILKDNTQVRIYTYNLLKSKEEQTLKDLRATWNKNKHLDQFHKS